MKETMLFLNVHLFYLHVRKQQRCLCHCSSFITPMIIIIHHSMQWHIIAAVINIHYLMHQCIVVVVDVAAVIFITTLLLCCMLFVNVSLYQCCHVNVVTCHNHNLICHCCCCGCLHCHLSHQWSLLFIVQCNNVLLLLLLMFVI